MTRFEYLLLPFLCVGLWPAPTMAQSPQISVTLPGRADSIFARTCQILRDRHFSILHLDSAALTVEALSSDSPSVRVRASHEQVSDAARITILADGGQSQSAGFTTLLELADALRPRPAGPGHSAPDGTDWPTDSKGRVGFLVLTSTGARWLKMRAGDTLPEIRPSDLPQEYRRAWEDEINDVGFDASCARFFRAGSRYVVRFNFCTAPTPDGDRFDVYEKDGGIFGGTIGPTVDTYIKAMCPATRAPWPPPSTVAKCPSPL
jgi:hypothetical protein